MRSVLDEMSVNGFSGSSDFSKDFDDALKNDNFREFVSKLDLPKDKLMKYTTSLEECSMNYYTCNK